VAVGDATMEDERTACTLGDQAAVAARIERQHLVRHPDARCCSTGLGSLEDEAADVLRLRCARMKHVRRIGCNEIANARIAERHRASRIRPVAAPVRISGYGTPATRSAP